MIIVAALGRQNECTGEGCARLQFNRVAAIGIVNDRLQVTTGIHENRFARRGGICHRALNVYARQFCGAVIIAARCLRFYR